MKKLLFILLALLLWTGTSWALNIDYNGDTSDLAELSVGVLDIKYADITIGSSGDGNELLVVNQTLFRDDTSKYYTEYAKQDFVPVLYDVYDGTTQQLNTFAFELEFEPEYYLVKFGNAGGRYVGHVLWQNNIELDWAVFNTSGLRILNLDAFSHFAEIGGSAPVPEPATMLLLGTGLVGLAGLGRKKFLKK